MTANAGKSPSAWKPIDTDTFLFGVPHYPEHVDESYLERDARRMAECGFNVVRMGEFAWHLFEPHEGTFEFALFDHAIEVLGRHGIKTIMCTPTATPPRWLTDHYPEILRVDGNGRPMSHGSRQHADTTSSIFRMHSRRITRAMAEHYAPNPHVVGWQTDNELNTSMSVSYSESARYEFQKFLRKKYGTIDGLNSAWGGNFWATAYDTFDQVVLPQPFAPTFPGPGHVQDYHRFLAAATAAFQHDQVVILREANPDWFVFHNLGHLRDIDFRGQFTEDLDFVGYDAYPLLHDEMNRIGDHGLVQARFLDVCRGFAGNFIVPEQQSGFGSQPGFSTLVPEPGEMRRMAMSSVAHGADGLMFFRWRPAHFGAEIYWMGIIDHDDVPRRRYEEAKRFGADIAAIKDKLLGTSVRIDVGIAGSDFDNEQVHNTYPIGLPSPLDDATPLHSLCHKRGIACGFVHPEDDLSRLRVFYVPHWIMWKDGWTERLRAFAEAGGTVIIGARTGSRDENNHVIRTASPGPSLSELCGVSVEEFGRLTPPDGLGLTDMAQRQGGDFAPPTRAAESSRRKYTFEFGGRTLTAAHCYEIVRAGDGTEVISAWSNRFLSGEAAITVQGVGKGRVVYIGTYMTHELAETIVDWLETDGAIAPLIRDLPPRIDVTLREADGNRLLFVLNTQSDPVRLSSVPTGTDLLSGRHVSGDLELEGYGCSVIELE